MPVNEILGAGFVALGVFFSAVGILGVMRFPDVYSRIHASGKVSTLGILGILLGTAFLSPGVALKAVALFTFLLVTSPTVSHSIAAAAHRQGVPRKNVVRDDLGTRQFYHAGEPITPEQEEVKELAQ